MLDLAGYFQIWRVDTMLRLGLLITNTRGEREDYRMDTMSWSACGITVRRTFFAWKSNYAYVSRFRTLALLAWRCHFFFGQKIALTTAEQKGGKSQEVHFLSLEGPHLETGQYKNTESNPAQFLWGLAGGPKKGAWEKSYFNRNTSAKQSRLAQRNTAVSWLTRNPSVWIYHHQCDNWRPSQRSNDSMHSVTKRGPYSSSVSHFSNRNYGSKVLAAKLLRRRYRMWTKTWLARRKCETWLWCMRKIPEKMQCQRPRPVS